MKGVLPSTAVLLAVVAQPAAAAFPGTNGRIAMERPGPNGITIATVNGDGTGERSGVIAVPSENRDASWAPDGRRLAFTNTQDGNEEIYVVDTETGAQTRLTFDPARDRDPSWSPDGTRLAFSSERDGNAEIYTVSSAGGPPTRLTADPLEDLQPVWSSTGAIAFARGLGRDFDIHVMDGNGAGVRRITQAPDQDLDPSWAPGGGRLAYVHTDGGGNFDVHAVDADGQNERVLASGPLNEHFPSWSPDGTRIAYAIGFPPGEQVSVMPAEGRPPGFVPRLASGTDPNWGPLPTPVAGPDVGRTVTIAPVDARVLIAPATSQAPATGALEVQLRTANEVPVGSTINAAEGTVAIEAVTTTPDGPGTIGHADVTGGVFTVTQIGTTEPTLRVLRGIRPCQRARISAVPPEARMRIKARGRFRTIGGYGRGAGRGTEWAMRERCDGTVFQVFEGVVLVHDYRRRRSFEVRAGRCYLAAVRRRADALRPRSRCPRVGRRR